MTTSTWTTDAPVMKYDEVRSHTERLVARDYEAVPRMRDLVSSLDEGTGPRG